MMHSAILSGHYLPNDTPIHRLNPRAKIISFFTLLAVVIITRSTVGYTALGLLLLSLAHLSKTGPRIVFSGIRRVGLFLLLIFLMNALFFNGDRPLWEYAFFHISVGGIAQGANVALKVIFLMALSSILMTTTTPMEITDTFAWLLSPLQRLRIPVHDFALMISIAIQFIPVLAEESETIIKAQTARAAKLDSPKLREKANALLPLVLPIFISAFRRADELALAMEARGFRGGKFRTRKSSPGFTRLDFAALTISIAFCAAAVILHR